MFTDCLFHRLSCCKGMQPHVRAFWSTEARDSSDAKEMQRAWQQGRAPLCGPPTFTHPRLCGPGHERWYWGPHLAGEMLSAACSDGGTSVWTVLPGASENCAPIASLRGQDTSPEYALGYVTSGADRPSRTQFLAVDWTFLKPSFPYV